MDQETGNIPVILAAMPRVATSKLTTVIVMQNDVWTTIWKRDANGIVQWGAIVWATLSMIFL